MIFLFKKPPITVDFFTIDPQVYNYYPVCKSTEIIPDWWKSLKRYENRNFIKTDSKENLFAKASAKNCVGFNKLISNSFSIKLHTDISFIVKDDNYYWSSSSVSPHLEYLRTDIVIDHNHQQSGNFFKENFYHAKINVPWQVRCREEINFYINMWDWTSNIPFLKSIGGVVDFKYQNSINLNFFMSKGLNYQFLLNAGIPLIQIIPLTEKTIKIKNHLIDQKEYNKIFFQKNVFKSFYYKSKKLKI